MTFRSHISICAQRENGVAKIEKICACGCAKLAAWPDHVKKWGQAPAKQRDFLGFAWDGRSQSPFFTSSHRFVIPGYAKRHESQELSLGCQTGQRQATRCPLGSILSALVQGTPPMHLAVLTDKRPEQEGFVRL